MSISSSRRRRKTSSKSKRLSTSQPVDDSDDTSSMSSTTPAHQNTILNGKNVGKTLENEHWSLPSHRISKRNPAGNGKQNGHNPVSDDDEKDSKAVGDKGGKNQLSREDKNAMVLLIILYLIQGIPIGLAFGSVPFLLKPRLSYSQLGVFSLCTYPYSLKLIWSPLVDSVYSPRIGRRKSWIVPMQAIIGSILLWIGSNADSFIANAEKQVTMLTFAFTSLVFFAATQDIAVDGWALTLLQPKNISYASTAQTIGLNCGYFLSFTVFLALNSSDFANKYFRSVPSDAPWLSLGAYMQFWGAFCFLVTLWLFFFKKEDPVSAEDEELSLRKVYEIMWKICNLKHIQYLCMIHFVAKIGFQANDAVTDLKLIEKGLHREDMALISLLDFPVQILGGYLAATWSSGKEPLRPWLLAFWIRLSFAGIAMLILKSFPKPPIGFTFFLMVVVFKMLSSFSSTVQFVSISAFHTQISDPVVGGTYMTLLNTISNLGGTWPRYFVLQGVDALSVATCHVKQLKEELVMKVDECSSKVGKAQCAELGGECITERDGYFSVSTICIVLGAVSLVLFIWPTVKKLQALPLTKWRVVSSGKA